MKSRKKTKSERIALLAFRYLRRDLTKIQRKELLKWRRASPDNESLFREMTNIENIRRDLKDLYDCKEIVWQKILDRVPQLRQLNPDSKGK